MSWKHMLRRAGQALVPERNRGLFFRAGGIAAVGLAVAAVVLGVILVGLTGSPRVELQSPESGALLKTPPVFSWDAKGCEDLYVVVVWLDEPGSGLVPVSHFVRGDHFWRMSDDWWGRATKGDPKRASKWMVYSRTAETRELVFAGPQDFVPGL